MDIGQEASERITGAAAQAIRAAIEEVGGREVFFAGSLDSEGRIDKVTVCARGHEGAVPAHVEFARHGDVVLHNHPSGGIAPSEADLDLSSLFSFNGLGVYIVDNAVSRVYVVVEPFHDKARELLNAAELRDAFRPASPLARTIPHFEVRPQQGKMIDAVARAFNEESIAVVEAPTGVGKTLAYLLPAVLWATRNEERVVVSTRTINLQEQIIEKDIPALAKCVDKPFKTVLVKGRGNYICLRRLNRAFSEATLFQDEEEQAELKSIAEWADKTRDGTKSDLPFVPSRELWEQVCSEADTCQYTNCQNHKDCFITRARREVAKADLIVANHHMLFADLAIKKETGSFGSLAVLPAYRRVIFDEAHNVEDSATEYFGADVTHAGAMRLIGQFIRHERGRERGMLPYLKLKLVKEAPGLPLQEVEQVLELVDNHLMLSLAASREALLAALAALRSLCAERCGQLGRDIKWRLTPKVLADPELREIHNVYVLPAVEDLQACARHCTELFQKLKSLSFKEPQESPVLAEMTQLTGYRDRLLRMAGVLAECTGEESLANTVRWIEIDSAKPKSIRIARCPLHVGPTLSEWVYGNLKTVVMTSATLSVQHNFDFLRSRIGLDLVNDKSVEFLALDSPFDFQKQAVFCTPDDIVTPDDPKFLDQNVDYIRDALSITRGHAFVLFTSFYALDYVYRRLHDELRESGLIPLKQGMAARTRLLDRFRKEPGSVLFATDSFWEGVDVAGEALQCVILPKLPFRVPTEPVLEARAEEIDGRGGNSFMEYTVPQAVIKFRQGFGRLIRRKSDRGAVVVLDRRIITKFYGRAFLNSLPDLPIVRGTRQGMHDSLRRFFHRNGETS